MTKEDLYDRVIFRQGCDAQICMMFEEMSELQKELCKSMRGKQNTSAIAEEIADVEIMLEQMKLLFEIDDKVEEFKRYKLERLQRRLGY